MGRKFCMEHVDIEQTIVVVSLPLAKFGPTWTGMKFSPGHWNTNTTTICGVVSEMRRANGHAILCPVCFRICRANVIVLSD